jgi:hypothetical protein
MRLREENERVLEKRAHVERLRAESQRCHKLMKERSANVRSAIQLFDNVEKWLRDARNADAFSGPEPALKKGEKPADCVDRIRARLAAIEDEINVVCVAPYPTAVAKAIAAKDIEALAERGRPNLSRLMATGAELPMSLFDVFLKVRLANNSLRTPGSGGADTDGSASGSVPDGTALLAWMFKDQLLARINAEIDAESRDGEALTEAQRLEKIAELEGEALSLARLEEHAIQLANANGRPIARRPDADPRAVLGLADHCAPRRR